jgi:hypothetical protein
MLGEQRTKMRGASCRNYRALHVYQLDVSLIRSAFQGAHARSALEYDWLKAGALGVCKCAHSFGGFVGVCSEEIVQAFVSHRLQEPFSAKFSFQTFINPL